LSNCSGPIIEIASTGIMSKVEMISRRRSGAVSSTSPASPEEAPASSAAGSTAW
jgi:hypothetical protein